MCKDCPTNISRRGFAGLAALGTGLLLVPAQAQVRPKPDTLCVMCIDYRYTNDALTFFNDHASPTYYDLVAVGGASLAAYRPATGRVPQPLQEQTNFAAKIAHPTIRHVFVLDHRNCGAYERQFGPTPVNPNDEARQHYDVAVAVQPMFASLGLTSEFWLLAKDANPTIRLLPPQ